jgi:hypothetical protein
MIMVLKSHGGKDPQNFAEKTEFKTLIKGMAHNYNNELNFQVWCSCDCVLVIPLLL